MKNREVVQTDKVVQGTGERRHVLDLSTYSLLTLSCYQTALCWPYYAINAHHALTLSCHQSMLRRHVLALFNSCHADRIVLSNNVDQVALEKEAANCFLHTAAGASGTFRQVGYARHV